MKAHRPTNNWGGGELPAPFMEGDVIDIPAGAKAFERIDGGEPGRYAISYATSIGEGDEWYFRVKPYRKPRPVGFRSDRLHVIYDRSPERDWRNDVDWLEGVRLHRTGDPEGLALRESMLAAGWQYVPDPVCASCGQTLPKALR